MRFEFSPLRAAAPVLLALFAAGCLGDATAPARPGAVRAVAGNEQLALTGEPVADALRVRVEDAAGNPVRGATVAWQVTLGGGAVDAAAPATDAEGFASARWTLGSVPGEQRVEARVQGAAPALFRATASEVADFRVSPELVRLRAVGDEQVLGLVTRSRQGTDVASGAVTWHSADPSIVSVFGGRLRAQGKGAAMVIAAGEGVADTILVAVGVATTYEPVVATGGAVQRVASSPAQARLSGAASGNGFAGHVWFEWGSQPDLSDAVQVGRDTLPAAGTKTFYATVGGLSSGQTFYFRAVAENSYGAVRGAIAAYTVAPPAAPTGLAVQLAVPNYLLKLTWTVGARTHGYAVEHRAEGDAAWQTSPVYTSTTGGYWAQYPDLTQTRRWFYRVRSCNAVGCTWSSEVDQVIPRLEPPQNMAAAVTDSGHVRLAWTDASAETTWEVFRRAQGVADPAVQIGSAARNATSYTDRTVLPGVTYVYTVRAWLSYGNRRSLFGPEVSATVGAGQQYPPTVTTGGASQPTFEDYEPAPGNVRLGGAAQGNGFAGHTWFEWGYQPDLSDASATPQDTLPASGTKSMSATITGVTVGSTLYFRAAAQNSYGIRRGAIVAYTVAPPEAATALSAELTVPMYLFKLYWTVGARTTGYAVEWRNEGEPDWESSAFYTSTTGGYWAHFPVLSHTRTVQYRVRSCNAAGCSWSTPIPQVVPRFDPPGNLAGTVNAANDVVLTWTDSNLETSYEVFRRAQGNAAPGVKVGGAPRNATTFTDTSALAGVAYVYTVRGYLTHGPRWSAFSNDALVTVGGGQTYPPTVATGIARQPTDGEFEPDPTWAYLGGTAQGNSFAGHVWFEWGHQPDLSDAVMVSRDTLPSTGTKSMRGYVSGLTPGETFYFRAVAENFYGTVRGAIVSYTVAPPVPGTGLSTELNALYLLKLYWTPGARTTAYGAEWRDQGTTPWTFSGLYQGSGGYWAHFPPLYSTARTVEYRAVSCNAVGCSYSAPTTHLIPAFVPPSNLTATVNASGDVVLSWTDSNIETSFDVFRRIQGQPEPAVRIGGTAKNVTTYTDTTPLDDVTYIYTVRGSISYDNQKSAFSNEASATP